MNQRINVKVGTLKTEDDIIIDFYELKGWRAPYTYKLTGPGTKKIDDVRLAEVRRFARATLELYKNAYNKPE